MNLLIIWISHVLLYFDNWMYASCSNWKTRGSSWRGSPSRSAATASPSGRSSSRPNSTASSSRACTTARSQPYRLLGMKRSQISVYYFFNQQHVNVLPFLFYSSFEFVFQYTSSYPCTADSFTSPQLLTDLKSSNVRMKTLDRWRGQRAVFSKA